MKLLTEQDIEDCLNIHGHPEYGTEIIWHDGIVPKLWLNKINQYRESILQ